MNKFNIGQFIWFIYDNEVVQREIRKIERKEYDNHIEYGFTHGGCLREVEERKCYKTKEELLKSL